jgi:hypothetical protein
MTLWSGNGYQHFRANILPPSTGYTVCLSKTLAPTNQTTCCNTEDHIVDTSVVILFTSPKLAVYYELELLKCSFMFAVWCI